MTAKQKTVIYARVQTAMVLHGLEVCLFETDIYRLHTCTFLNNEIVSYRSAIQKKRKGELAVSSLQRFCLIPQNAHQSRKY